jgi:hypothetical protein
MRFVVLIVTDHTVCEIYKNRLSNLPVVFSSEHSAEEKMKEEFITDYRTVCIGV